MFTLIIAVFRSNLVSSAPINVSLVPISSTQLQLSWRTPSHQNGVIKSYYITWRIVRNDTNHIVDGELKTAEKEEDDKVIMITKLGE